MTAAAGAMATIDEFRSTAAKLRNWGRWSADDQLGTLNFITPDTLKRAAATVCGESYNPVRLGKSRRFHACMAQTMDAAVKQVNAPLVTARYVGAHPTQLATK